MELPDLKPCPFCGNPEVQFNHDIQGEITGIWCGKCKAHVKFMDIKPKKTDTFGQTMEQYAEKWDRREGGMNIVSHGNGLAVGVVHGGVNIGRK